MDNQVVYQFNRNENESVYVSLREFKNRRYLDLRVFFQPQDDDEMKPTKKGLTIALELLPELKKGILICEKTLQGQKMSHKESISPLQK